MNASLRFMPQLVVRTPQLPFNLNINEDFILDLLNREWFMNAIYIASPVLYEAALKLKEQSERVDRNKIIFSLTRYYIRMSTRATPFGLFSAIAIADWSTNNAVQSGDRQFTAKCRFDIQFVSSFLHYIQTFSEVKQHLVYYANNSLYRVDDEWRFNEINYLNNRKKYDLSSIEATTYLDEIIRTAVDGITFKVLIEKLQEMGADLNDANSYFDRLINSGILVSELDLTLTGSDVFQPAFNILESIENNTIDIVRTIWKGLGVMPVLPENLKAVERTLSDLGLDFKQNMLFQVDSLLLNQRLKLEKKIQTEIIEVIDVLSCFKTNQGNPILEKFKELFTEKFGDQEVPFLKAMDSEIGIDYMGQMNKLVSSIIPAEGFADMQQESHILNEVNEYLMTELINCNREGKYEFKINKSQLKSKRIELPPSFSVVFQILNETTNQLYIEQVGGSSALSMIGRFTSLDEDIYTLGKGIADQEASYSPSVIFAEIIHLPDDRMGNILFRRPLRSFEIPYLAKASVNKDCQISVNDLFISIKDNNIVLRSGTLNKIIVPRLSSAHNYNSSALPVYHFLCQLQSQHVQTSLTFSWGTAAVFFNFLPRVTFKQHILFPATWRFKITDVKLLFLEQHQKDNFNEFCLKWKLPRYFKLADDDNELLIDSKNYFLVKNFLKLIRNREQFELIEFIEPITSSNNVYLNQFVAAVINDQPCTENNIPVVSQDGLETDACYDIGSEWIYYKLYCTGNSADRILLKCIYPFIQEQQSKGWLKKWFFVRYNDPHFHLRIRFQINDIDYLADFMRSFSIFIETERYNGFIWKVQTDTYMREIYRYGSNSMETGEEIFHLESNAILTLINTNNENDRWMFGMLYVDAVLSLFKYSDEDKLLFVKMQRDAYFEEFKLEKSFKDDLNQKYQGIYTDFSTILSGKERKDLITMVEDIILKISDLTSEKHLTHFLPSYFHMFFNRLFHSHNRLHEYVLYEFLRKYYNSRSYLE